MKVVVRKRMVGNIPLLEVVAEDKIYEPLPLIIYYHGWQTAKELVLTQGRKLAAQNFRVLLPDAANHGPTGVMPEDFLDISFVLSMIGMIFVSALIMSIVGGLFQFAAWTKFDYPDLSVIQCLKYGWFLLKDRIGTYILLQLSFIGWYLLGAIALFIGLLWVIVYVNVSVAEFYEQARIEKGGPDAYFT